MMNSVSTHVQSFLLLKTRRGTILGMCLLSFFISAIGFEIVWAHHTPEDFIVDPDAAFSSPLGPAIQYLFLGYEHILPEGLDHILFVLGLFFLSNRFKSLLWQVTAFTLAHSVTLALSSFQVISLSASIVEPLIALSIVYVAVENLYTTELKPWRPLVVFGFGLIHGLGFAGVLAELGLPQQHFLTSLITFNVGVELGQLSVIALAYLVIGWFRSCSWYRPYLSMPASCGIALVASYWTIERIMN